MSSSYLFTKGFLLGVFLGLFEKLYLVFCLNFWFKKVF